MTGIAAATFGFIPKIGSIIYRVRAKGLRHRAFETS